jgi:hypothetical protein
VNRDRFIDKAGRSEWPYLGEDCAWLIGDRELQLLAGFGQQSLRHRKLLAERRNHFLTVEETHWRT